MRCEKGRLKVLSNFQYLWDLMNVLGQLCTGGIRACVAPHQLPDSNL